MRALSRTAATAAMTAFAACALLIIPATAQAQSPEMRTRADSAFAARVQAAIRAASDVPADSLQVVAQADGGLVLVVGSVLCEGCGGNSTPGGTGTVQQSLGAVVRAVPGVQQVRFDLRYRPPGLR